MDAKTLFDVTGRHILVTGASSGLGWHFATRLAGLGARVSVAARRLDRLEALRAEVAKTGGEILPVAMDVADPAAVKAAFDAAAQVMGPVDVVVNNAGMVSEGRAENLTDDQWRAVVDVNLSGVWTVATEAARRMIAAGRGGAIVNIASILGLRVAAGVAPYAVSKAGVVQMTKALALEWARHGIRVNALAPGYIETDLNREFFQSAPGQALIKRIPQRRLGQMADLDGPLLLLCSDASTFMTGTVVTADGGHLVSTL